MRKKNQQKNHKNEVHFGAHVISEIDIKTRFGAYWRVALCILLHYMHVLMIIRSFWLVSCPLPLSLSCVL